MSDSPMIVAVTGMNCQPENPGPGLAVVRSLRQEFGASIRIIGLSYDVLDAGLYLNEFCDAAYLLPYPSAGEQPLLQRLEQIQQQEGMTILIPCLDAELLNFIRLKDQLLAVGVHMVLPTREQLLQRNKDRLDVLAAKADIRYPESKNISHNDFFYHCHDEGWRYPMVVKGLFYDAKVVYTPDEGAAAFRSIAAEWGLPVLVQRYAKGHEVNLVALGDGQGEMIGAVMMRKKAVTDKGKAWAAITIHDPHLEETARKLIKELRWSGPLEVEILKEESGQYLLIEINPRFPAWVYLATEAGVNLPAALVRMMQGEELTLAEPETGKMMIRYAQETVIDLKTFESMMMSGMHVPL
ncbi:MAG: ATP-grasp domain-containing protein [Mariprofundaceae bacterium]|nr:ATP-grasp domain-containing protein [Mariprofundaceae bacterium]